MAVDSLVSGGCIISGSTVRRSVLFSNVRVQDFCDIEECWCCLQWKKAIM